VSCIFAPDSLAESHFLTSASQKPSMQRPPRKLKEDHERTYILQGLHMASYTKEEFAQMMA